jgi:hypothetical protein
MKESRRIARAIVIAARPIKLNHVHLRLHFAGFKPLTP